MVTEYWVQVEILGQYFSPLDETYRRQGGKFTAVQFETWANGLNRPISFHVRTVRYWAGEVF